MGIKFPFWHREFRVSATAPIITSLCSFSSRLLLHYVLSLHDSFASYCWIMTPPHVWFARSLLFICDQLFPNFRYLVLAALKSLVVYYPVHLNVFLGCSVLNPFKYFPFVLVWVSHHFVVSTWADQAITQPTHGSGFVRCLHCGR